MGSVVESAVGWHLVVPAKAGTQSAAVVPAKAGTQSVAVVPAEAGTQSVRIRGRCAHLSASAHADALDPSLRWDDESLPERLA